LRRSSHRPARSRGLGRLRWRGFIWHSATFVTLSLASGKTESWVADRTGHRSSNMINRYRRQARQVVELNIGTLAPLYEALHGNRIVTGIVQSEPGNHQNPTGSSERNGAKRKPSQLVVHEKGLEPSRVAPPEPKACRNMQEAASSGNYSHEGARRSGKVQEGPPSEARVGQKMNACWDRH
jgi:hypothetical protein